ncbi:integrase core domain-containing protein [Actinomadura sp. CNU-125]|uniref:integrase core domain-containing protein n=1 Tax=Actinomadura sp. CNU-125 TaxID=1904961 RepID=UPI00096A6F20
MAEALNATSRTELIHPRTWRSCDQVESIAEWVSWYNHRRLHTAIGDVPPIEYETSYHRSRWSRGWLKRLSRPRPTPSTEHCP